MRRRHEEGAALLTVLLMVAVIGIIAVGVLEDIRFGLRRSFNAQVGGQARWYALGGEQMARSRIDQLLARDTGKTTLEGDWNGRAVEFPIEGGVIQARLADATGCFNLNSVVEANQGEPFRRRELGVRQLASLISLLGAPNGPDLAESLAQWIDSNDVGPAGLEDDGYASAGVPHRTAGGPLAEVSELRAVRGFDTGIYATLRPYVCALPTTDLSPINVNTLPESRAVLLSAITLGAAPPENARRAIAARPAGGWSDLEAFWGQKALAGAAPVDGVRDQIRFRTRYFSLESRVGLAGGETFMTSLFEAGPTNRVHLVARRWTLEE
ncbi:type II secretion system minor pseudopilin GspK [Caulobacter endophyticus]|uniref:Type II secretion system protein K n=1 Tax=Caulobacter endophyticus TaxID=2172652 RepID=A0A2T9JF00_9CAUL|nr:type II secretion system minor pseudopilin GspK [Caulobacter endophyticus]PVM82274.1 type II secretion system protein K [Caulobacter endophyticus]